MLNTHATKALVIMLSVMMGACARAPVSPPADQSMPAGTGSGAAPSKKQRDRLAALLANPSPAEGGTVFSAHGYSVSRDEYVAGYERFLAERVSTAELEGEYRTLLADQLLVVRWLEEGHLSDAPAFFATARQQLRETLAQAAIEQLGEVTVSDAEVRELYRQRRDQYLQPERVQVRIILLPTPEEAEAVLDMLEAGESFGSLAMEFSRHESRHNQGELEPFARGEYNREFEEKAFSLQPGETGILNVNSGSFIMQKTANIPATVTPFEEVSEELARELLDKRTGERRAEVLARIREEVGGVNSD